MSDVVAIVHVLPWWSSSSVGCYGSGGCRGHCHRSYGGWTSRADGWKVMDGMMLERKRNTDFKKNQQGHMMVSDFELT
jgi:hypothetical protein